MRPSTPQLLKQLRRTTRRLLAQATDREQQGLLAGMDVLVNELLLRGDAGFYHAHYRRGRELLERCLRHPLASDGDAAVLRALPGDFPPEAGYDAIADSALRLTAELTRWVNRLCAAPDAAGRALCDAIVDWELALTAHAQQQAAPDRAAERSAAEITPDALLAYLRGRQPAWTDLSITRFHRVPGGFSKCTVLFDTHDALNGAQAFALRAEQPIHMLDLDGANVCNEFPVMRHAFEHGVPVPEPLWVEADTRFLGMRFSVLRQAAGANFGTVVGAAGRIAPGALADLARVLACIHRVPLRPHADWVRRSHFGSWLDKGCIRDITRARVEYFRRQGEEAGVYPSPGNDVAYQWLLANVPENRDPPVFLHGDYGPHNILLDGDRVSGVLDWEVSIPWDPAFDVAYFLNATADSVDRDEFLALYAAAGGQPLSDFRLRYFDVFMCYVVPVTTSAAARLVEDNDATGINLAFYALQFRHAHPGRVRAAIAAAEAARGS